MQRLYNTIASSFDKSRYARWPGVIEALNKIPSGSKILDVGCGNGKYLNVREDCEMFGCDISENLIEIAKKKNPKTEFKLIECASNLPYPNEYFDAAICIAVIHHIRSYRSREKAIKEIRRVVKENGLILITLWADTAISESWTHLGKNDFYVPWKDCHEKPLMRFYHMTSSAEAKNIQINHDFDEIKFEKDNWYIIKHPLCYYIKDKRSQSDTTGLNDRKIIKWSSGLLK
jgi:alkylated DNA repair protein alkB family protein 8